MNRQQRRAAERQAQKHQGAGDFSHLPEATVAGLIAAINGGGGVFHMVQRHDDRCPMVNGGSDCICNPDVSIHRHLGALEVN